MSEPTSKRRRVRKGTRSCWECRRRKVKCRFASEHDAVCVNCVENETPCVSQKESPDPGRPAVPTSAESAGESDRLARRVEQLEKLLSRVVGGDERVREGLEEASIRVCPPTGDLLDGSAARNAHGIAAASSASGSLFTPGSSSTNTLPPTPASLESAAINHPYIAAAQKNVQQRYQQISRELHAMLPSAAIRSCLAFESPGASMILNFAHSRDDQIAGRTEPHWSLASASWPAADTHPVLIAKRLLQYAVCMQHLPPTLDPARLELASQHEPCVLVGQWVAAVTMVTNDDEMVGCAEGIETLMLMSMFEAESGHLRRAWMTTRRALGLGHLLGIDRPVPPPVRSCATADDPRALPSMPVLWYRISCSDRYHSLILGLTPGSRRDNFTRAVPASADPTLEALGKAHAVLCRRIVDRNDLAPGSSEALSATRRIEDDFSRAAADMERQWWEIPALPSVVPLDMAMGHSSMSQLMTARAAIYAQVRHFTMLILLHLPFLLRVKDGAQYDRSRLAGMDASRAVLQRFLVFRKGNIVTISGRPMDYSALIAGMTLLLGHLGQGYGHDERTADRDLIERTLITFRELGTFKRDRLSSESAETLSQLLPILTMDGNEQPVTLAVPFLGTVKINARPAATYSGANNPDAFANLHLREQSLLGDFELDPQPLLSFDAADMAAANQGLDDFSYLSSNLEGWVFQGIDTTYWSMLNQGINGMSGEAG